MLKKSCMTYMCPNLTTNRSGYCDECEKKRGVKWRDRRTKDARPSASERGYDARWAAFSRKFLSEHPVCELCGAPAEITDHKDVSAKVMMDLYGRFDLDESHYQALCRSCNVKKAREDKKRDSEYFDGLKLLSKTRGEG